MFLFDGVGGVFVCFFRLIWEDFGIIEDVWSEVGVFKDCIVRDVVIKGGGCLGNVLLSRLYNNLMFVLWFVDKFVWIYDEWLEYDIWLLLEVGGFCEVLEKEVLVFVVFCVVNVFKYFFVDVDRDFSGVV